MSFSNDTFVEYKKLKDEFKIKFCLVSITTTNRTFGIEISRFKIKIY